MIFPLFLFPNLSKSAFYFLVALQHRLVVFLCLRPCAACCQRGICLVYYHIHMIDERGICGFAIDEGEGVDTLRQRAVGGIGFGARLLRDAGDAGGFFGVAGGGGGHKLVITGLELRYPGVDVDLLLLLDAQGSEVLQQVVQAAILFVVGHGGDVAVFPHQLGGFGGGGAATDCELRALPFRASSKAVRAAL